MMSFKEQCIALRKLDYSVTEIMSITGRPKTSVYAHIRDIPLSPVRMQAYRDASGARIRTFAIARKGKSEKPFLAFDAWTPQLTLLVAHLMFDGGLRHGITEYSNRSEALIARVETLMANIYDFPPNRRLNENTGVHRISYFNVALASFLKRKSKELALEIGGFPPELQREFLRAFFDDEGCMDFKPHQNKRRIRGYQKDISILELIKEILSYFGIESHIELPNEVVISGKQNLSTFQQEIGFSPEVRINGKRSNSFWKESLEKRELLQRAIDSFKS